MPEVTLGEREILEKVGKTGSYTFDGESEDGKIADKMADKDWLNREFIVGNKTSYNLNGTGQQILKKLGS